MLEAIKKEANRSLTENGALTNVSTYCHCLDLFATAGALRSAKEDVIVKSFLRAYTEDPDLAMKLLFFARDIRGGLGERRFFRLCLQWLGENHPDSVRKNLKYIAQYGRWDDLLCLLDGPCGRDVLELIRKQLAEDVSAMDAGDEVSLLAKWLPSVNASNRKTVCYAKRITRFLGLSDAAYRKTLVQLRQKIRILENNLRTRDYSFDYEKQPSKAMFKYRKSFFRNDEERYMAYLEQVSCGKQALHTDTLLPYELIAPYLEQTFLSYRRTNSYMRSISEKEKLVLNATWNALPDYTDGENALAVVDTSGSMYMCGNPLPGAVALSLGLYFAERNRGAFRNYIIEFSETPALIELKGETFADRLAYAASFSRIANTNLEAVFDLLLQAAAKNHIPQEELPKTLYLISDMEFDRCVDRADLTNFEHAKRKFAEAGYVLPKVVFWNVQSRNTQQPVTQNEQGVALVSGCTPRLFAMLAKGRMSPMDYMLDILLSDRYAPIAA